MLRLSEPVMNSLQEPHAWEDRWERRGASGVHWDLVWKL